MLQKVPKLACITITSVFQSTLTARLEVLLQISSIDIYLRGKAYMATYKLEKEPIWTRKRYVGCNGSKLRSQVDINNKGN